MPDPPEAACQVRWDRACFGKALTRVDGLDRVGPQGTARTGQEILAG